MVTNDEEYYCWKTGEADEQRLADIKADIAIAKIVGQRILQSFGITELELDCFEAGSETVRPQDLVNMLTPGELDPREQPKALTIRLPGNGKSRGKGRV
jgi:hypothetical protein